MRPAGLRWLAFVAALAAFPCAVAAQVGRVAGTISGEGNRPIRGATITAHNPDLTPSTITGSTDERGKFSLLGLKRGVWNFIIQAPGYEPQRVQLDVVTIKPNPPLNVHLVKGAMPADSGPLARLDAKELQGRLDAAEAKAAAGELDAAIATYREILARVPALTSLHLRIGQLLERKPDVAAALAEYRALAEKEPDNARAQAAISRLSRNQVHSSPARRQPRPTGALS